MVVTQHITVNKKTDALMYLLPIKKWYLVVLTLFLVGCSTTASKGNKSAHQLKRPTFYAPYEILAEPIKETDNTFLLTENSQLATAHALNQQGEFEKALTAIDVIDLTLLSRNELFAYSITKNEIFTALAQYSDALLALKFVNYKTTTQDGNHVFNDTNTGFQQLTENQKPVWLWFRGNSLLKLEEYMEAAYMFYHRAPYIPIDTVEYTVNESMLWLSLNSLDISAITTELKNEHEPEFRNWLELARLNFDNKGGIEGQLNRYFQWTERHSQHSKKESKPYFVKELEKNLINLPKRVGLILPFSGPFFEAGTAIRDGFLATYYSLLEQGYFVPELFFYNSGQFNDNDPQHSISTLYQQIKTDKVDFLVGPLNKTYVRTVSTVITDTPILLLNKNSTMVTNTSTTQNQAVEFSLTIEDEVDKIVEKMIQKKFRRVLVLGSNRDWSHRAVKHFTSLWNHSFQRKNPPTRTITGRDMLKESSMISNQLSQLLNIDQSINRRKKLQNILGKKLEFVDRRRKDVDAIFLAVSATEARQVKPLLAFYFAKDLPVYSSSFIFSGTNNTKLDNDLEGINFLIMPWLIEQDSAIKKTLMKYANTNSEQLKFYAMGQDSYHMHQRFGSNYLGNIYHGAVGALSIDKHHRIKKQQVWVKFKNGKPENVTQ